MGVLLFLGILLPVVRSQTKDDSKPPQQAPEFYDEPKFTVSDVADPTSLGGHGSNATAATRQSLAEDVQAIKGQSTSAPTNKRDLENALQRDPDNAHLHHQLAELEEHSGNAVAAVKQFQRAAELDPSEQNLLDWGSELVAHGAAEPAGEGVAPMPLMKENHGDRITRQSPRTDDAWRPVRAFRALGAVPA